MKTNLLNAFKQTFAHVGELALIIVAAWIILTVFNITGDQYMIVVGLVLAAFTKFARASDSVPVPDYVNSPTFLNTKPADDATKKDT